MSSQIDAVATYLHAMWAALAVPAGTLNGVNVVDGPQANLDPSTKWLFVASDASDPSITPADGARSDQSLMTFLKGKQEEGEITSAVIAVRGDDDSASARADAYAIFSAAEDAVRNDMQLGGLVMHAYVARHRYYPTLRSTGVRAKILFQVNYQAHF